MVLSLTLLKGTGTKITQLYLADAALATGQSRHHLLQRLTGCSATGRADPLQTAGICHLPDPSQRGVCSQRSGVTQEPPGLSVCSVRCLHKAAAKGTQQPENNLLSRAVTKHSHHYIVC